jgi:hypothetical protein
MSSHFVNVAITKSATHKNKVISIKISRHVDLAENPLLNNKFLALLAEHHCFPWFLMSS